MSFSNEKGIVLPDDLPERAKRIQDERPKYGFMSDGSFVAKEMEAVYYEKPGLGCRPYWVLIPERMSQLAEAIKNCDSGRYDKIELWGMEIALLAKLKAALDDVRNKR